MYNWSTDTKILKEDKQKYIAWQLEQAVNFGLGKYRLDRRALKKNWSKLKLDPAKRNYLKMLLWR